MKFTHKVLIVVSFWREMWYNNLKQSAVERRQKCCRILNLKISFENIEPLKPSHCGATTATP